MSLWTMIIKMAEGLGKTSAIFSLTLLFSLPLGVIVALLRMSKNKIVSGVTRFVISVLRDEVCDNEARRRCGEIPGQAYKRGEEKRHLLRL